MELYDYETRFALYGEWQSKSYESLEMNVERSLCAYNVSYIMKRVSKDAMKESSRDIAKVVHANPLIAFGFIVDQIKSYDNLIGYLVDSFRFVPLN